MTYNTLIFSIAIFAFCSWIFKSLKLRFALASLITLLCNLPFILSLSVTQWLDSVCGNPSLFLALLSIGSLLSLPTNPLASYFLPMHSKHLSLSNASKIYLVIFGFILFWGNINYLWGFDPFNASFSTQILFASLITAIGYLIQPYLGFLLLFSMVGAFFREGSIFVLMMDALVWLYALLSLLCGVFVRRKNEK